MRNIILYKLVQEEIAKFRTQKELAPLMFKERPSENASQMVMVRLRRHIKEGTLPPMDVIDEISEYFKVEPSYLLQECEPETTKGKTTGMNYEDEIFIEPFMDDVKYIAKKGSENVRRKMKTMLIELMREVGDEELEKMQDDFEEKKVMCSALARQTSTQHTERKVA